MVFDASSIFEAVRLNKAILLQKQYTTILAGFELGNILWKNTILKKTYSPKEAQFMANELENILTGMRFSYPLMKDVLKVGIDLRLTYYDASYVQVAIEEGMTLVTEDEKILKRAGKLLKVCSMAEIE